MGKLSCTRQDSQRLVSSGRAGTWYFYEQSKSFGIIVGERRWCCIGACRSRVGNRGQCHFIPSPTCLRSFEKTSGSIASPAKAAGIVGLKPTVGLTSRHGVYRVSDYEDSVGILAQSVEDAAIVLTAIAGKRNAWSCVIDSNARQASTQTTNSLSQTSGTRPNFVDHQKDLTSRQAADLEAFTTWELRYSETLTSLLTSFGDDFLIGATALYQPWWVCCVRIQRSTWYLEGAGRYHSWWRQVFSVVFELFGDR